MGGDTAAILPGLGLGHPILILCRHIDHPHVWGHHVISQAG